MHVALVARGPGVWMSTDLALCRPAHHGAVAEYQGCADDAEAVQFAVRRKNEAMCPSARRCIASVWCSGIAWCQEQVRALSPRARSVRENLSGVASGGNLRIAAASR